MVIGYFKNKTYYKDLCGNHACIIQYESGAARLIINTKGGKEKLNKIYKTRQSALIAWNRFSESYKGDLK